LVEGTSVLSTPPSRPLSRFPRHSVRRCSIRSRPSSTRVTHIPIYELAFIWGVGPRVEEPGINQIRSFSYSGPLEDLRVKRP